MSAIGLFRLSARPSASFTRTSHLSTQRLARLQGRAASVACHQFSTSASRKSGGDGDQEESFEEFTARQVRPVRYCSFTTVDSPSLVSRLLADLPLTHIQI